MDHNRKDDDMILLDPRRNQCTERKKLFEEMLLKEIPGQEFTNTIFTKYMYAYNALGLVVRKVDSAIHRKVIFFNCRRKA